MKSIKKQSKGVIILIFMLVGSFVFNANARDYYQLKIYKLKDKVQETTVDNYLKNAYLPALHRAGIKKVGVFKPIESDEQKDRQIIVFIPMKKLTEIERLESKLLKDETYQSQGSEYINASHDNPPYQRIETILLKSFRDMPKFSIPKHETSPAERVYELRSYEGPTEKYYRNKVEMFNEGGEMNLFKRLNFQAVFYGEVISGSIMPNLMYMTTFSNMESRAEHWKTFGNDPEWKKMSGLDRYQNNMSNSIIQLLHPTEYSDL